MMDEKENEGAGDIKQTKTAKTEERQYLFLY